MLYDVLTKKQRNNKLNMVTNQIMKRQLDKFIVEQRTKDGMFNATHLLKQWNESTGQQKTIAHYMENSATQEFVKALMDEESFTCRNSAYVVSKARTDRGGGTWMHPLMFIDFAMWLNAAFKVKVLKFVSDQMLAYRNEAGEAYKVLSSAVGKIVTANNMKQQMPLIAKAINWVVFGNHQKEIRNDYGEEQKQRELFEMERQIAMLINDGFLRSKDEVINYLRRKFSEKYIPQCLR